MKHAVTGFFLVCAIAIGACGRSPAAPSALSSATATGVSLDRVAAKNSEQVVFSGVANGSIGFWIWCEAESENPYEGECNGSMYFYALGITKHVEGEVTEPSDGSYLMDVSSTLDSSVHCLLQNPNEAVRGPHNRVNITCSSPSASAASTTAVVNVTGPPGG